jgi:hypothetical protein
MTPSTGRDQRHLKYGRFGRHPEGRGQRHDSQQDAPRGRWTGYRPLSEAVAEARLGFLLTEAADGRDEETER